MSEDLTGRRIGHYRIDGVLGRGGMSVMYRATDIRLGRRVALKVIAEHLTKDPEFRERFVDEARNTSAVDHSNVVPVYDFGEVDGLLYIAMRLVDGSDLASLLKDGPMTPGRAIALLGQIAQALDVLNGQGLVHLDVKPANVLVTTRESANEHVYLADFGLTRRGATGHRTRGGDFLGSPTYAAPEHLRGEPVDGRTDEYSLACVLFACLAGRAPFLGTVSDAIYGHLNREAPALTGLVNLPGDIDQVIRRGMAKEPDRRYPDCRQLIAAAATALTPTTATALFPANGPTAFVQAPPGMGTAYLPQPPAYRPVMNQQPAEMMRLRPPAPAGVSPFAVGRSGPSRWLVPVLVGLAAIVVIVGLVVGFGGIGNGGNGGGTATSGVSTATTTVGTLPTVKVGPSTGNSGQLPTNFPGQSGP